MHFLPLDAYSYYNPYISSMYIRKAKNEDDYNEEGGEEKPESYQKPQYWAPENPRTQEQEVDYKGNFSI